MRSSDCSSDVCSSDRSAALLQRLKGIGPVIATVLAGELFWKDFQNRRELGGYLGLAPSPWRSGRVDHEQGISKAGNRRARQIAIELAWRWLRQIGRASGRERGGQYV